MAADSFFGDPDRPAGAHLVSRANSAVLWDAPKRRSVRAARNEARMERFWMWGAGIASIATGALLAIGGNLPAGSYPGPIQFVGLGILWLLAGLFVPWLQMSGAYPLVREDGILVPNRDWRSLRLVSLLPWEHISVLEVERVNLLKLPGGESKGPDLRIRIKTGDGREVQLRYFAGEDVPWAVHDELEKVLNERAGRAR